MKYIVAMLCLLALGGCAIGEKYFRPAANVSPTWKAEQQTSETLDKTWWNKFNSQELLTLVSEAEDNNTDLRAALQRINQARAQAKIANATLFPAISAGGNLSRTDSDYRSTATSYTADLAISYEVDLWQHNANTRRAAKYTLQANIYDRDALALVVTTDAAQRYFEILTLQERIRLTTESIKVFRDTAGIIDARFKEGAANGLEVAQQNTTLANAEASLASLRQQLATTENALALLLGKAPQQFQQQFTKKLDQLQLPLIKPTQPASLLERRPDVRAQEEILKAANADVSVARTNIFPSLTIGATGSIAANALSASPQFAINALASVAERIFESGRLEGEVELAKARQLELVETYRTVVLTAFREAEDAMASIKSAAARQEKLGTALKEARNSFTIARASYLDGASDFITLLDAQRNLLQAQDSFTQAKLDRLAAAMALFKALGGGWQDH